MGRRGKQAGQVPALRLDQAANVSHAPGTISNEPNEPQLVARRGSDSSKDSQSEADDHEPARTLEDRRPSKSRAQTDGVLLKSPRKGIDHRSMSSDQMDQLSMTTFRGICGEYFDSNVSPVLRFVQQAQEQLHTQVQDLRGALERKADATRVPSLDDFGSLKKNILSCEEMFGRQASPSDVVPPSPRFESADGDSRSVKLLVRLQELSAALHKKADVGNVPTLAQFKKLSTTVDQKANVKDVEDLRLAIQGSSASSGDNCSDTSLLPHVQQFYSALEQKANVADVATSQHLSLLRSDLETLKTKCAAPASTPVGEVATQAALDSLRTDLKALEAKCTTSAPASSATTGGDKADMKKMQVIVAAAGARFDKQLRELRQQVKDVRQDCIGVSTDGTAVDENRWPGRVIGPPSLSGRPESEDALSDAGSISASVLGSVAGSTFGPEERLELKKIQTVVAAAGTAFSRDMKDVRKQVQQLRAELTALQAGGDESRTS